MSTLSSLPPELLERVAIFAAAPPGDPRAIAKLGQADRLLRSIVCSEHNQQRWREVFLDAFDDPRNALEVRTVEKTEGFGYPGKGKGKRRASVSGMEGEDEDAFNWEATYRARIYTAALLGLYDGDTRLTQTRMSIPSVDISCLLKSIVSASAVLYTSPLVPSTWTLSTVTTPDLDFGKAFVLSMPSPIRAIHVCLHACVQCRGISRTNRIYAVYLSFCANLS
jgi:hypothetical protein